MKAGEKEKVSVSYKEEVIGQEKLRTVWVCTGREMTRYQCTGKTFSKILSQVVEKKFFCPPKELPFRVFLYNQKGERIAEEDFSFFKPLPEETEALSLELKGSVQDLLIWVLVQLLRGSA